MKKNGRNLLTWEEMLSVEDRYPFSAGNLRSLRLSGFRTRPQRGRLRVRRSNAKLSPTAKSRPWRPSK
jgi:hypothetical protein